MLHIDLFGTTRVHTVAGGARDVDVCGVKPRQILEMLAARLGSPVTKDVLAEGLWAGRPPASYVASVESYVCVLRRSLAAVPGRPLVTTHGAYLLDPRLVRVDLVEARAGLAALESMSGQPLVEAAVRALDAITGEVLAEEPFADWAADVRRSARPARRPGGDARGGDRAGRRRPAPGPPAGPGRPGPQPALRAGLPGADVRPLRGRAPRAWHWVPSPTCAG